MSHRIVISIVELSKSNWTLIYRFIDEFYKKTLMNNVSIFNDLQEKAILTITSNDLDLAKDACSADGEKLTFEMLPNSIETTFSIIYIKQDDSEDFSYIVPFFLLKRKFTNKLSLGIDVGNISVENHKQNKYIFKCSDFFRFIEDKKPLCGKRSIYFINEKIIDKDTKEIRNYSIDNVTSLVGKSKSNHNSKLYDNAISEKASRRYIPLLKINEKNFSEFFGQNNSTTKETKYIKESIEKISTNLRKKNFPCSNEEYNSIFEEWFTKAYFYSLNIPFTNIGNNKFEGLKDVLHSYCNNIYELVQNIIFHTKDKNGLIYFVFNKKENIPENQKKNIPDFDKYTSDQRFVEIGIFDYNEQGIVESYIEKYAQEDSFELKDFFDTHSVLTTGLNHLDLRHAAHMGIKSFVKTILNNRGFFSVESNHKGIKQSVESVIEKDEKSKSKIILKDNNKGSDVSGTHYRIILPIKDKPVFSSMNTKLQVKSFLEKYNELLKRTIKDNDPVIESISFRQIIDTLNIDYESLKLVSSKEEQTRLIETLVMKIVDYRNIGNKTEFAFNLSDINVDAKFLFRLLAYLNLQLSQNNIKKIILFHLSDKIIDDLCQTIKDFLIDTSDSKQIWNDRSALILISDNLRYQIICGKTKNELFSVNHKINLHYANKNFFDTPFESNFDNTNTLDEFILPYELLIKDKDNDLLCFEQYLLKILKQPIESKDIGYLVSHEYTRIGSKLIIKNFYEADSMFYSSFFTERFAYVISQEIINSQNIKDGDNYILIGYKPYSELLIKSIEKMMNSYYKNTISTTITANEEENRNIRWRFDKTKNVELEIVKNPIHYKFITIVPIGSTLTTNDKIIALSTHYIKREREKLELPDEEISNNFIYNHCAIVVRDKIGLEITNDEKSQKWDSIIEKKIINTTLQNAKKVHFSIQIGAKNENENNWFSRLDKKFFPDKWQEEEYVNDTHNSSLNSQNLMGYPRVLKIGEEQYNIEYERLEELKDNIHFGHIESHKSHFRYYIDTEKYVQRKEKPKFNEWIKETKKNFFKMDVLNVLITPNINIQSDFVEIIKKEFFNDNALIITIDVNNWRNNIIYKFSYLTQIRHEYEKNVKFHFVDHVLLTSETYKKAKSYMLSILNYYKDFHFESIITLINRLSYDKNEEIKNEVGEKEEDRIFAFLNLFIPPSKDPERDCSLCALDKYYGKLKESTVLANCDKVIAKNKQKIQINPFDSFTGNLYRNTNKQIEQNSITKARMFNKMKFTHKLFYQISNIAHKDIGEKEKENEITKVLDEIYENIKNNIDDKISFLKVISSPPLSQYIKIRNYAMRKLLNDLDDTLNSKQYNYDITCELRVILKQLSFLKSNALVRKEVITKSWALYYNCKSQIDKRIESICTEIESFEKKKQEKIASNESLKKKLQEKESQKAQLESNLQQAINNAKKENPQEMFPTSKTIVDLSQNISSIEKDTKEMLQEINELYGQINCLQDDIDAFDFQLEECKGIDFQSKFQFYIKNATHDDDAKSMFLGELLRTGEENAPIEVSKTTLNNSFFSKFADKDYKEFLVWLFYDNTTIIRKTLENFDNELKKDKTFESYFYDEKQLKPFNDFKDQMEIDLKDPEKISLKDRFKQKIRDEYYYSNFNKYLNNGDDIKFVEKLLYVLYAKLKLKDLIKNKHKKDIETDTKSLLEIFVSVMDANAAFFSMKKENEETKNTDIYVLSNHELDAEKLNHIYNRNYYTSGILKQIEEKYNYFPYPIIHKDPIENNATETELGNFTKLNLLLIENTKITEEKEFEREERKSYPLGAITFLYNDNDEDKKDIFKICSKEHGRLLLLLKNELNEYIIDYLLDDKIFDLWIEKSESKVKFEKIYLDSDHSFGSYEIKDKIDFDELDPDNLIKMYRAYFSHTNLIINHIYSNIEKRKELTLFDSEQINFIKIKDIFDNNFLKLIKKGFRKNRNNDCSHCWVGKLTVNEKISDNAKTTFHKQILRAFVIQCVDNAMYEKHLQSSTKNISLEITDEKIIITNDFTGIEKTEVESRKNKFSEIKKNIQELKCHNYSCMTLTALQGYCKKFDFSCDFDFDKDNKFKVIFKVIINLKISNMNKSKILIIEDEGDSYQKIIESVPGYDFLPSGTKLFNATKAKLKTNLRDACGCVSDLIKENFSDLRCIILDIELGSPSGYSGINIIEYIRNPYIRQSVCIEDYPWYNRFVPIIVYSAYLDNKMFKKALKAGGNVALNKNVSIKYRNSVINRQVQDFSLLCEKFILKKTYKVGLTFCGEDTRLLVRDVANILAMEFSKHKIFFDEFHRGKLSGLGADEVLSKIYTQQCEYVVLFMSENYQKNHWTGNVEWQAIKDKLIPSRQDSIILVLCDEKVKIDGIDLKRDIAIKVPQKYPKPNLTSEEIADLIIKRMR
jgi:CheY-like chemotaxis protein